MAEECITITIDEEGKLYAETSGFKGETCLHELENLLGDLVELNKVTKTDEYYQKAKNTINEKNRCKL